jgi:hypothetical protein
MANGCLRETFAFVYVYAKGMDLFSVIQVCACIIK